MNFRCVIFLQKGKSNKRQHYKATGFEYKWKQAKNACKKKRKSLEECLYAYLSIIYNGSWIPILLFW